MTFPEIADGAIFYRLLYTDAAVPGGNPDDEDFDGDGLSNITEVTSLGTDPLNPDTDGDLSPDGEEVDEETDPNDPNSSIRVMVAIFRQLFHSIGTEGTPPHWYHTRSYYKWTSNAPGYELFDEDPQVNTLPAFESLSGNLIGKYEFPDAMPAPPARKRRG